MGEAMAGHTIAAGTIVGELSLEDLAELELPVGGGVHDLENLKEAHHKLAMLLAQGVRTGEAAMLTGYSISRICALRKDPAFMESMAYWSSRKEDAFDMTNRKLADVAGGGLSELQKRLSENPAAFRVSELVKVATMGLDRTGHGPTTNVKTLSVALTGDEILKLKEDARKQVEGRVIAQENSIIEMGEAGALPAAPQDEQEEAPGLPEEGDGVREASGPVAEKREASPGVSPVVQLPGCKGSGLVPDGSPDNGSRPDSPHRVQVDPDQRGLSPDEGTLRPHPGKDI